VRQLDAVASRFLTRLADQAPLLKAGQNEVALVDVDDTIIEVHGYAKQGAGFGYTRVRGYHPLLATRADTGEILHIRLRKGSANSSRGMLRFTDELIARHARGRDGSEAAARRLGVLVEQDVRQARASRLAVLDRRPPVARRPGGDRGDR